MGLDRPCLECPFLIGSPFERSMCRRRAAEIADSMRNDGMFPCHKTTVVSGAKRGREQWCAGALGTRENDPDYGASANQMARIARRFNMIDDPANMNRTNLYDSLDDWVEAHPEDA